MTPRTVSLSTATNRAIADAGVPDAEPMMIVALRIAQGWRDPV
jgi:hypothetical protein